MLSTTVTTLTKLFKPLVLVLIVAWPGAYAADRAQTLLIVGDSLSAGFGLEPGADWTTLLQHRLLSEGYGYRVVNASITGDTTTGGLARLPRALRIHQPSIVLIELGGNDGLRGTPIALIEDNLARMIRLARDAGARVILAGMQMPPNYGSRYVSEFAAVFPRLAAAHDVVLIDFILDGIALNRDLMQPDGIHPNAEAQARLLDNAWPAIESVIRKVNTAAVR